MTNRTADRERVDPLSEEPRDESAPIDEERARRAANLFDLRRLIGGLFLVYGVILTVLGITASDEDIKKAAGINLNLWVGLSLLVVGGLFLAWAFARPLSEELDEDEGDLEPEDDRSEPDELEFTGSQATSRGAGRDRVRAGGNDHFRRE